jgi:predicted ATPase
MNLYRGLEDDIMNETLYIENFLVIKKAEIQLNKITLLIGPQASGKSLIAKLCHFFKQIPCIIEMTLLAGKNKRELDKQITRDFYNKFSYDSWSEQDFYIKYQKNNFCIEVSVINNKNNKTRVNIKFNDNLTKLYNRRKRVRKNELRKKDYNFPLDLEEPLYTMISSVINYALTQKNDELHADSFFIPASRSFFSHINKHVFTLFLNEIKTDPFIIGFGGLYEAAKNSYEKDFENHKNYAFLKKMQRLSNEIIDGEYRHEKEKDWIIKNNQKTELFYASSGQQEALPMLLTLLSFATRNRKSSYAFIEEPEAHLFPEAQSKVMAFLSHLYAEYQTNFFLTSHSPYILSALNNHILAAEVVDAGKMAPEKFTELNGYGVPIPFSDVAAYTICDGEIKSIRDEEYQMIGGDILDGISDHFGQVTDTLLNLRG